MQDPREKTIFRYFNGERWVWGDPLRIQRALYAALGDPDAAFAASDKGDARATNIILDNAREALGMAALNIETGEGTTDEQVEAALDSLWKCLEKKSENIAGSPSS